MVLSALIVSFGAFLSTFAGGLIALRAVRYVGVIIALGAGIRIGAAFFDLIPESIEHTGSLQAAMVWTAAGFLAFYALERWTTLHVGHEMRLRAVEIAWKPVRHERPREELRRAAGGQKVREHLVVARPWQGDVDPPRAVGVLLGMEVLEMLHVLADHEQVVAPVVDRLEAGHSLS